MDHTCAFCGEHEINCDHLSTCDVCGKRYCEDCEPYREDDAPVNVCEECIEPPEPQGDEPAPIPRTKREHF